jgi:hypothetical protein
MQVLTTAVGAHAMPRPNMGTGSQGSAEIANLTRSSAAPPVLRAALQLRPLRDDGREVIVFRANCLSDMGQGSILGRHSRDSPSEYGIKDPRVSRKHVRVDLVRWPNVGFAEGLALRVTALGSNPVALRRPLSGRGMTLNGEGTVASAVASASATADAEGVQEVLLNLLL